MISRLGAAELCHSGEKFSAMTERKPQLFEVLLAQIFRYVEVNVVSREDLSVLFKADVF
jgi:hypothetical protein